MQSSNHVNGATTTGLYQSNSNHTGGAPTLPTTPLPLSTAVTSLDWPSSPKPRADAAVNQLRLTQAESEKERLDEVS